MQPFQQRVVDEQRVLEDKITALERFVEGDFFKKLPKDEQDRLTMQAIHMDAYNDVLRDRIKNFSE